MTRAAISVMCLLVLAFLACSKEDTNRPVYYPDSYDLTVYTKGPVFDNLAQARQWAEDQHRQRRDPDWGYEIGKNCRGCETKATSRSVKEYSSSYGPPLCPFPGRAAAKEAKIMSPIKKNGIIHCHLKGGRPQIIQLALKDLA